MKNYPTIASFLLLILGIVSTNNGYSQLVINEIHPRLAANLAGDMNGDGVRNTTNDEFIEFANAGTNPVDISGWKIHTGANAPGALQHIFYTNTIIPPGGGILLFGGPYDTDDNGTSDAPYDPALFGGIIIQTADNNGDEDGGAIGLTLTDPGTTVRIYDNNDNLISSVSYTSVVGDAGKSVWRDPDITGAFNGPTATPNHPALNGGNSSAGFKADGSPLVTTKVRFAVATANVTEDAGTYDIVINIYNPSPTDITEFDLVLQSGDAADIGNFTTIPIDVPAGQNTWTQQISITDDEDPEAGEVLTFSIDNLTGGISASTTTPSTFDLTVLASDLPIVSFAESSASVQESGTYQIAVAISEGADSPTSVDVVLESVDSDNDINGFTTFTVQFPANEVADQTATITITEDMLPEENESFVFNLENPQGGVALGINTEFTLTIQRNDIPNVIINEILPWPAGSGANPTIDANGDGQADFATDEMFEIVNNEAVAMDISGWQIGDATTRYSFPPATILAPGEAVIAFAGWEGVEPAPERISGARVFFANGLTSSGFGLGNTGDVANLWTADNVMIDQHDYGLTPADDATSFSRTPDITGAFAKHQDLNGIFVSPGLKQDGTVFTTQVKFQVSSASVTEGDGSYDLHVSLLNPTGAVANTTFEVALTDGEATELGNYETQEFDIPAGQNDIVVPITITDNANIDGDRDHTFTIQNVGGGMSPSIVSPSEFVLTVTDDDATRVSFVSTSASVNENVGTFDLVISIESPSPDFDTNVEVHLASHAEDANDYSTTVVNFPAGSSANKTITITITDDDVIEVAEDLVFSLMSPSGGVNATVGTNDTFMLTIHASDAPSLIISEVLPWPAAGTNPNVTVDANGDGVSGGFTDEMVELVNNGTAPLDVSGWKVGDAAPRFTFPSQTVLAPGEAVVIFGGYSGTPPATMNGSRIFIGSDPSGLGLLNTGDVLNVWTESDDVVATFNYGQATSGTSFTRPPDLSDNFALHPDLNGVFISPGAKSSGSSFTTQVYFKSALASKSESDGSYEIEVTCVSPLDGPNGTFDVALVSGDAQDIGNYVTQVLQVAPGTSTLNVPVTITDNDDITGSQTFTFRIQNATGGVYPQLLSPNEFTLTITDNDISSISFENASASVSESAGLHIIRVTIAVPSPDHDTSVDVVLADGSGDDVGGFTMETLVFPAGSNTSQEVELTITDDTTPEADEVFTLVLQNALQNGVEIPIEPNDTLQLTILANDPALIINEIHGNPAVGVAPTEGHGDANGDSTRSATGDEFIEFVNTSDLPLDISGFVLRSGTAQLIRHTFPQGTIIPARGALVLFGGQTPVGTFGGSIVQVCNATSVPGLSAAVNSNNGLITNGGTTIKVQDTINNVEVVAFNTPDVGADNITQSLSRIPDISGNIDLAAIHPLLGLSYFSPGTKVDGSAFITTLAFDTTTTLVAEGAGTYNVVVHLNRSNDETDPVEFDLVLASGDAADLNNFVTQHISVHPDSIRVTIPISIQDDSDADPLEQFVFEIKAIEGGYFPVALNSSLTLTIDDNDGTQVEFIAEIAAVNEGDGTYSLQLAISNPGQTEETIAAIALIKGDSSAVDAAFHDFTVTFPPGSTSPVTVNLTLIDDNITEQTDTLVFRIESVSGGIAASAGVTREFSMYILDNDRLIVINEFCPFPSISGEGGVDANGDGNTNGNNDEFIEIVNTSGAVLDVTGWTIVSPAANPSLRFTFPAMQLKPDEAVVVFGGWHTAAKGSAVGKIGKSRVLFAAEGPTVSTSLGMLNTGGTIEVRNASDEVQTSVTYTGAEAVNSISRTLSPDVTGSTYIAHPPLDGRTISPGLKADGAPFIVTTEVQFVSASGGLYENDNSTFQIGIEISLPDAATATTLDIKLDTTNIAADASEITFSPSSLVFEPGSSEPQFISITVNDDDLLEGDELFNLDIVNVSGGNLASAGTNARFGFRIYDNDMPVIFNEVHAAPATGITGDANNDGTREATDDEFVELVNVTDQEIDMSGWKLVTGTTLRHTFLPGTKLMAGKALVVFGGGIPVGLFGGSQYQISSEGGLGLSDNGQTIVLNSEVDELRSGFSYGAEGNIRQSLTRSPDITGYYLPHSEAPHSNLTLFSPGTLLNGMPFGDITTSLEPEVFSKTTVHPNPASTTITVSVPDQKFNYDFTLTDVHGRQVKAMRNQAGTIELDVRHLPDGMLVYRIMPSSGGRSIVAGKLWIQK